MLRKIMEVAMREILKNCIQDGNMTGLYRISFPTGSGKSYESVRYMAENYQQLEKGRYFFFVTSKKINLPVNQLRKRLGEEEFDKNVIVLKSYQEYILNNFKIDLIPQDFRNDKVDNLKKAIDEYQFKKEKYAYDQPYIADALKVVNEAESEFRNYIYELINSLKEMLFNNRVAIDEPKSVKDEIIKKEVYERLKYSPDYQWIGRIYENIYVKDYKIILMSITKFMKKNTVFFEPRYSFINGSISDNAIIFIDEFDSSKETITEEIIDRSLNNLCEYISLASTVCKKMLNYQKELPKIVQSSFEQHEQQLKRVLKLAKENYEKYHLDVEYKCHDLNGRNFLFNDFSYQSVLSSYKYIYVQHDADNNCMQINFKEKKNETVNEVEEKKIDSDNLVMENDIDIINMYNLIRSLNRMILDFKSLLLKAAKTYEYLINGNRNPTDDQLSLENAISTLCSLFRFEKRGDEYIKNGLIETNHRSVIKNNIAIKKNNYYSRGFKYYELQNRLSANEFTDFNLTELIDTPEAIIAYLASKAKVIGMSATVNIDSVLCNYSHDYLKRTLGDNYKDISIEDYNRIKESYDKQNAKYQSNTNPYGQIKVHVECVDRILNQKNDLKDKVALIFQNPRNTKKVLQLLSTTCKDSTYKKVRYLSIAYVFKEFIQNKSIKSFLCLTNPTVSINGNFDYDVISKIFEIILLEVHINSKKTSEDYLVVLKSGNDFDSEKEKLFNRLKLGEKVFVMAAYGTLEAGQNLPYPPAKDDILINLNDEIDLNDDRNKRKDFDGIYLGEMTNIITNIYDKENEFTRRDLFHYLIQAENLYENNEINYYELSLAIKNGFTRLSSKYTKSFDPISKKTLLRSKCGEVTKKTVQSVGRLCRTFNKRSDIYIYISKSVFDLFDRELLKNDLICPEVQVISEYVDEYRGKLIYEENNNQAEHISFSAKDYIYQTLSSEWTEELIEYWRLLRELVLQSPTVSSKKYNTNILYKEYYIKSNELFNRYYFYEVNDFSEVYVLFDEDKSDAIHRLNSRFKKGKKLLEEVELKECSLENSRLESILRYPGMKEHFKLNGYATTFKANDYMMCPILYQNIYKGALGEVSGKFILESELHIELQELTTEFYEFFDYQLTTDIYIDFKHWRMNAVNKDKYIMKIQEKLAAVNGKKAYIINILVDEDNSYEITKTYNGRIIEVPYLIDLKNNQANKKIIEMLREDLINEQNNQ